MIQGWAQRIAEAQEQTTVQLAGDVYARRPYGSEYGEAFAYRPTCRDCACRLGELHVPRCCVEVCPRCGGQAISCRCSEPL